MADSITDTDKKWMRHALDLAEHGAGFVSPNPMVGCVIVSADGQKIGQGFHERHGEAHAEKNALDDIADKSSLEGATVYVTLEPCAHHGNTPPCCELLADWPVERVVVAMEDPTPKVAGKGIAHLRNQNITVDVGLMQEEAERLNEFFLYHQSLNRPFITLKIAQTLDGYTAAADGSSEWISGPRSRALVHRWRSRYDAVMVGRNTARIDNPRLTVRHVEGRQPRRIVIDGPLELPEDLNLFSDQYEEKTIVLTHNKQKHENEADPMLDMLQSDYFRGQTLLVDEKDGHTNLRQAFRQLGQLPLTSVLVEAGQQLASVLLREQLVDKVECFIAPKMLGGGTKSVINLDINRMSEIMEFREVQWQQVGNDLLFRGYF